MREPGEREHTMGVVQDPVADMLCRLRNAQMAGHATMRVPASNLKEAILKIFSERGYIGSVARIDEGPQGSIEVELRYDRNNKGLIQRIQRVSKPSRRVYVGVDEIPSVLNGLGLAVLSTSRGVLADIDARAAHVGGELLCTIY
jgi:small subunit ribosomal protein S8